MQKNQQRQLELPQNVVAGDPLQEEQGKRKFFLPQSSAREKLAYFGLTASGFAAHLGAVWLTFLIIGSDAGREGNPIFYVMGAQNFVLFGFVLILGYYYILWKIRIPQKIKFLSAGVMTGMALFDFAHDYAFLTAQSGLLGNLVRDAIAIITTVM